MNVEFIEEIVELVLRSIVSLVHNSCFKSEERVNVNQFLNGQSVSFTIFSPRGGSMTGQACLMPDCSVWFRTHYPDREPSEWIRFLVEEWGIFEHQNTKWNPLPPFSEQKGEMNIEFIQRMIEIIHQAILRKNRLERMESKKIDINKFLDGKEIFFMVDYLGMTTIGRSRLESDCSIWFEGEKFKVLDLDILG